MAEEEIILCGIDEKMGSKDMVIKEWKECVIAPALEKPRWNGGVFLLIRKNILHVYEM